MFLFASGSGPLYVLGDPQLADVCFAHILSFTDHSDVAPRHGTKHIGVEVLKVHKLVLYRRVPTGMVVLWRELVTWDRTLMIIMAIRQRLHDRIMVAGIRKTWWWRWPGGQSSLKTSGILLGTIRSMDSVLVWFTGQSRRLQGKFYKC